MREYSLVRYESLVSIRTVGLKFNQTVFVYTTNNEQNKKLIAFLCGQNHKPIEQLLPLGEEIKIGFSEELWLLLLTLFEHTR